MIFGGLIIPSAASIGVDILAALARMGDQRSRERLLAFRKESVE